MTTTLDTTTHLTPGVPMDPMRKAAFFGGLFYLITFASSIPAVFLLSPVINDANYIVSAGADTQVVWGNVLDLVNALTAVGSAVALYPVLKRQSQPLALGFVTTRVFEAGVIAVGVLSLLSVVTLQQPGATGAEATSLVTLGGGLVATYNWSFLLGQSVMPVVNALLLGSLLYRSRLVPRVLPVVGFIGAALLLASDAAVLFGLVERVSALPAIATLPIALWEFSLGIYLVVKGFKPSPITADMV